MEKVETPTTETERMRLLGLIRLAGEIIAPFWPMRTFVHHNPLHGLERLPFDEAVRLGDGFLGGKGYLSGERYRDYFHSGRILLKDIDAALSPYAEDKQVVVGNQPIRHIEVLRACLLNPTDQSQDISFLKKLASHLSSLCEPGHTIADHEAEALLRQKTLSAFLDRVLETDITKQINAEMIKWLAAFLDEGQAAWPMPKRTNGFYSAWKSLVAMERSHMGIPDSRKKLTALSGSPEETIIACLHAMGVPHQNWQGYLTFHLCALPGWSGFIKWRADQEDYDWQASYPIHLSQYLAVRLWYERELVEKHCQAKWGIAGNCDAISTDIRLRPAAYSLHGKQPAPTDFAKRLVALAAPLKIGNDALLETASEDLAVLLNWVAHFGASQQGPIWLAALEAGYRESLLSSLKKGEAKNLLPLTPIRPQAQAVFCIDIRSEPFRRHLEAIGDYETFGFAGFFAAFIRYRALGDQHQTDQFPVIMKWKNEVREIPRANQGRRLHRHRVGTRLVGLIDELFHDLKENVVTPYVMVECVGWLYAVPLIGKTTCSVAYRNVTRMLQQLFTPPIATSLTINKLSREAVETVLAAEQRAVIRTALNQQFSDREGPIPMEQLEGLRLRALGDALLPAPVGAAQGSPLQADEEASFIKLLRDRHGIDPRGMFARMERMTRTGFTLNEQIFTVETALKMMGLTQNFARLVLFCGHGGDVLNNPYESALDCGACGGHSGKSNARVLAAMANTREVREGLAKNGILIPSDTCFIAGEHITTTDEVRLFDLEDVSTLHRTDLDRLMNDLKEAGVRTGRERLARLPQTRPVSSPAQVTSEVQRWGGHWSQVRPEWGLSGNAALIIGRRKLTRGMTLEGRAFLHSYDYRDDDTGRLLEIIMTGPQVVAQWINMEHYFSTVDNDIYGSGSKIYHNVVGRFGVMSGPSSDLRVGLSAEAVMNGTRPYHEPMRLLVVIEAPRERIDAIIPRHPFLQQYYDNEWVQLVALDPGDRYSYRHLPKRGWLRNEGM
jgi:uncharacterized protein YbcC (UPF0753/DUF2309 family)